MSALELLAGRIPASWSMMLLDGAVKGFLVLAIAAMVAMMLRHRSSAVRHLVWTLGVLALLLMPLISWLVPGVDVPMPMSWAKSPAVVDEVAHAHPVPGTAVAVEVAPVIATITTSVPHGATPGSAPRAHASRSVHIKGGVKVVAPALPAQRITVTRVPIRHDVVIARAGSRHSDDVAVTHSVGSNVHDVVVRSSPPPGGSGWWAPFRLPGSFTNLSFSPLSVPGLLFGTWLIGALIALTWMLVQQVRLFVIESRAQPIIGGRCARMVDDIAWELGIDKDVVLLAGSDDAMPMTWGVFRPVLLLPATAMVWSRERLSMVLRHELAHVARRDAASQAIAELACALHWYNPLVWLAASRMRVEREHACDDLVLESGPRASDYATELLDIARTLMVRPGVDRAAIAMARRSELKQRLSAVLDEDRPRARPTGGVLAAALLSAMGIVFPLAALEPAPLHSPDHAPAPVATADVTPTPFAVPTVIAVPLNIKVRQTPVCRRAENGSATTNRNNDNWRIQWEGQNCRVDIRIDGEIRYDAMFTEITGIASGGRVQLEEQGSRGDRRLVIRPVPQGLAMEWQLNGEDAPFDAAAREWYGLMLQEIARTTGIGADERAAAILERHGTAALMREIEELRSDRVRARYYRALLLSDRLDTSDRVAGVIDAAAQIKSDRELSSLLRELTDRVAASPDLRSAVLSSASGISSDREKVRLYLDLVNASTLTDAQKADVLASSRTVQSDRERNRLLAAVAAQSLDSRELHASYIDATREMSSDREKSDAFGRILEAGSLNEDQLVALFDAAQTIHSDRELARLLMTALETQAVQGPAREAFVRAMDNISSEREHGRVASMLSREGR